MEVVVFWIVTPVVGYRRFGGITHQELLWIGNNALDTFPLPRTSTLKMDAVEPPKRRYPSTTLHGAKTQKTMDSTSPPQKPRMKYL
jgi:hypothetical protein